MDGDRATSRALFILGIAVPAGSALFAIIWFGILGR
jgi:hypothetical protein